MGPLAMERGWGGARLGGGVGLGGEGGREDCCGCGCGCCGFKESLDRCPIRRVENEKRKIPKKKKR